MELDSHPDEWVVLEAETGKRLDLFLVGKIDSLSRTRIQMEIKSGHAMVNGKRAKPHQIVETGDQIRFDPAPASRTPEFNSEALIPLPIVHRTEKYLVINKPPGLLSHPPARDSRPSVAGILGSLFTISDPEGKSLWRPGIVHRLDRETSGLMIVALDTATKNYFMRQFAERRVQKTYRAITTGIISETNGRIEAPIGRGEGLTFKVSPDGREAVTDFTVIHRATRFTEVQLFPKTGRTHQLRLHLRFIQHPIVNDPLYSKSHFPLALSGQLLCAEGLEFLCPVSKKPLSLHIKPDSRFTEFQERHWR